jgi:hypothetical protein
MFGHARNPSFKYQYLVSVLSVRGPKHGSRRPHTADVLHYQLCVAQVRAYSWMCIYSRDARTQLLAWGRREKKIWEARIGGAENKKSPDL